MCVLQLAVCTCMEWTSCCRYTCAREGGGGMVQSGVLYYFSRMHVVLGAIPCCSISSNLIPSYPIPSHIIPSHPVPSRTIPYHTIPTSPISSPSCLCKAVFYPLGSDVLPCPICHCCRYSESSESQIFASSELGSGALTRGGDRLR